MHNVYIGSKNPVKIECSRRAFEIVFPELKFQFSGFPADSGVKHQPVGEEETLRGALNRLNFINKNFPTADFWIGIEGGIETINDSMYAFAWVAVKNSERTGKARTATFELPPAIQDLIKKGYELGEADDLFFKRINSKHNDGTVGKLTSGIIDRIEYYKHALILALIPFKNSELFS